MKNKFIKLGLTVLLSVFALTNVQAVVNKSFSEALDSGEKLDYTSKTTYVLLVGKNKCSLKNGIGTKEAMNRQKSKLDKADFLNKTLHRDLLASKKAKQDMFWSAEFEEASKMLDTFWNNAICWKEYDSNGKLLKQFERVNKDFFLKNKQALLKLEKDSDNQQEKEMYLSLLKEDEKRQKTYAKVIDFLIKYNQEFKRSANVN